MSQIQKLDSLIVKIIKEELDEKRYAGPNAVRALKSDAEYKKLNPLTQRDAEIDLKKGGSVTLENEEEMQDMEQKPKASEIAGQLAEIMEKLKSMAEGEDPKKAKHAAKVMKYMESAKAALEALTAHEVMLEEKDQEKQTKAAEKHRDRIEKIFKSIVKDENIVNRLKDKLSAEDIVTLTKKLKDKGKDLDEEKLARIVLNRSLQEGWVKKK